MRYKHYKNANVKVSELGIGTWALGGSNYGSINREEAIQGIRKMIEQGVNLIDTAPVYGNGTSEKLVGEAIRGLKREDLLISTKAGLITTPYKDPIFARDASFKNIIREVESSLFNLGTDYIDFYFIHWPDPKTPIMETMTALNLLKQQGKIRYIGVSNFTKDQIMEAEKYGKIDVQQPPYSMVDQRYKELIEWGYERGIDAMTYGSLGSGILSGKIRELPEFDEKDIRVTFYDHFKEPKFSKIMQLLSAMDTIADKHRVPLSQIAINWSTQKEFVGSALVGVNNPEQAIENCKSFEWELSKEEIKLLDDSLESLGL